ncbi:hypothetical protein P261_00958 [Lachnospiraceae bacterium TWA4]|nr:hypothetical protein P261_00958 [Lachnospiraceae bacterium TWA4]
MLLIPTDITSKEFTIKENPSWMRLDNFSSLVVKNHKSGSFFKKFLNFLH